MPLVFKLFKITITLFLRGQVRSVCDPLPEFLCLNLIPELNIFMILILDSLRSHCQERAWICFFFPQKPFEEVSVKFFVNLDHRSLVIDSLLYISILIISHFFYFAYSRKVLSTRLLYRHFLWNFRTAPPYVWW